MGLSEDEHSMKIGLFITGHLRDAPKTYENYVQFLRGHDTNVYIGTWSTYDINRRTHELELGEVDVEQIAQNIFGDSLKKMWVGDIQKFESYEPPVEGSPIRQNFYDHCPPEYLSDYGKKCYPWQQRVLDQWYTVLETYKLCPAEEYDNFDICIRIRGDMSFIGKPPIPFEDDAKGIHVNGFWWTDHGNDATGISPWRVSDQLGWGLPVYMRKYFEYYNYFIPLFAPLLQQPETIFHYGSEHMFAYYLLKMPYFNFTYPDVAIHRHGFESNWSRTTSEGVVFDHDFYTLINKETRELV